MMKKILAGSIMLAMASAANAGVYTETKSFGTQGSTTDVPIGTLNETITIDGFNSFLGGAIPAGSVLTGVTVTVYGQIDSAVSATNDPANASNARFDVSLYLYQDWKVTTASADDYTFQTLDFVTPYLYDESSPSGTYTIAPGDSWSTSITSGELSATLGNVVVSDFLNAVDFNFTTFANTSLGAFFENGTGQVLQQIATASWGQVVVDYTYENAPPPHVPEPGLLALLGLGLAGFGFGRARKRA